MRSENERALADQARQLVVIAVNESESTRLKLRDELFTLLSGESRNQQLDYMLRREHWDLKHAIRCADIIELPLKIEVSYD